MAKSQINIDYVKLAGSIGLSLMAGIIGGVFTSQSIPTWYATLTKPDWNPPNWVFGPVWTILYILIGISLYLLWTTNPKTPLIKKLLHKAGEGSQTKKTALTLFAIQLVLNTLWSIIFFGLKNPGLALIEIILLWFAIAATIHYTAKLNKLAAYLLVPYILWVSFATILNLAIVTLN
jgi:translocator protein